jgi:hypothetical protein
VCAWRRARSPRRWPRIPPVPIPYTNPRPRKKPHADLVHGHPSATPFPATRTKVARIHHARARLSARTPGGAYLLRKQACLRGVTLIGRELRCLAPATRRREGSRHDVHAPAHAHTRTHTRTRRRPQPQVQPTAGARNNACGSACKRNAVEVEKAAQRPGAARLGAGSCLFALNDQLLSPIADEVLWRQQFEVWIATLEQARSAARRRPGSLHEQQKTKNPKTKGRSRGGARLFLCAPLLLPPPCLSPLAPVPLLCLQPRQQGPCCNTPRGHACMKYWKMQREATTGPAGCRWQGAPREWPPCYGQG